MIFNYLLLSLFVCYVNANNITIIASWNDNKFQVLNHFWKNTGFSPLGDLETRKDYILTHDEKVNLAMVGSVPNGGITHVRIHWLLDLVRVKKVSSGRPEYCFQYLDELIDWLHQNGLFPCFELMGNPSNYFYNFITQSDDWHLLIKEILSRYIDIYGAVYLYHWRFELMNEPDLKMYNTFNFTLHQYINYFRTSERALGRLIGPAGLFRNKENHPLCWGLLNYCNLNPCNLQVVTYHRKGDGTASNVIRLGLDLIRTFQNSFPNLTNIAYGNDEADIMTGWYKPMEWRSDVRYASSVLQVIIGHINEMYVKRSIPFQILSNDNAFLNYYPNYFTQRTLLARFQMNNTTPTHVQFIRKPVYSAMGLLSLLGSYVLDIDYLPGDNGLSYVLTAEKLRINFLGTVADDKVKNEPYNMSSSTLNITIKIGILKSDHFQMYAVYIMDNFNTNPFRVWQNSGNPDFPDKNLRRRMRKCEGIKTLYYKRVKPHVEKLTVTLPRSATPIIFGINVCNSKYNRPGRVKNLHFLKINNNEILLLWNDESVKSKCLLTYVVEFRNIISKKFERINDEDSIFLSYHFDGTVKGEDVSILGEYRVAAMDYFGRLGQYSNKITISYL